MIQPHLNQHDVHGWHDNDRTLMWHWLTDIDLTLTWHWHVACHWHWHCQRSCHKESLTLSLPEKLLLVARLSNQVKGSVPMAIFSTQVFPSKASQDWLCVKQPGFSQHNISAPQNQWTVSNFNCQWLICNVKSQSFRRIVFMSCHGMSDKTIITVKHTRLRFPHRKVGPAWLSGEHDIMRHELFTKYHTDSSRFLN